MNGKTMSRYPARGIADWLLMWAQSNEAPISNHKLQQLLYYAQGRFLGDTGNPVFEDGGLFIGVFWFSSANALS